MKLMYRVLILATLAAPLTLTACNRKSSEPAKRTEQAVNAVTLDSVIADPRRGDEALRDQYRHPKETLAFFGLEPGQSVAEIWPGWYTKIIAPYLTANNGTYTAVLYDPDSGERAQERIKKYMDTYSDAAVYGPIQYGALGPDTVAIMPDNSADMVLTFRNVHNWMGGGYAEKAFKDFYKALKPGGILGVVEHRLPESSTQDPTGRSGYVQESYIKDLAKQAGFEFVDSSEINANPKDTADHPMGVWTLPPASRAPKAGTPEAEGFDPQTYLEIGESDRMTLKFRKPL